MKIQDNIANEFDAFSKNYTQDMIGCVPYYLELISSFTKNLPRGFNPKNILDLGCGNGNVTQRLVKRFPKGSYTLIDASPEMLGLCKQLFKGYQISYISSYFQDFTFSENSYDLITAGFSLHHCNRQEKQELFAKIYTSLKKGGIFACADLMISKKNPAHSALKNTWQQHVNTHFPGGEKWKWLMEHYDEFDNPDNYKDQVSWLKEVGFQRLDSNINDQYWIYYQTYKE